MNRTIHSALVMLVLSGCQGMISKSPPIHLNPNMDQQDRLDAQEPSPRLDDGTLVWKDNRAERPAPSGTVAVGQLEGDDFFDRGMIDGQFASTTPMAVDAALLERGESRYGIYCVPCHDSAGSGRGTVATRGLVPPPTFHQDRIRQMPVGQIFDVITQGARTMPSYAPQIPTEDRWAIAAYVRALQLSQHATLDQVPADVAAKNGWR